MENIKKSVSASIAARFAGMKTVEAFKLSDEAKALINSDPLQGIARAQSEKAAYESLNSVNPLESVALQAVLGAVTLFATEEEAFAVLNKAKVFWRNAKGLRALFLSTLNEAEKGEFNGDLNRAELVKVCRAWQAKGEMTASAFVLAHSLQDTAKNVLSQNVASVARIAQWKDIEEVIISAEHVGKKVIPPVKTAAQVNNEKAKLAKAGK
jgi:hypothetical protein